MPKIHPTAIISEDAKIGANVEIGPYCVINGNVTIKNNSRLFSHVNVNACGSTIIGENCTIHPFASVGSPPQDKKYIGEDSHLEIGNNNVIREYANINPGTSGGGMLTKMGDDNLIMVGVHIAHDCLIGNGCIIVNYTSIAGHVTIDDYAIVGGNSGVHQFVKIGSHAMIGAMSAVDKDIIPFAIAVGNRAVLEGLNIIGLKRHKFSRVDIQKLREIYKLLFTSTTTLETLAQRIQHINSIYESDPSSNVQKLLSFIRINSQRHFCSPQSDVK